MTTVSDILNRAADLIEPEGAWTQYTLALNKDHVSCDPKQDDAACFCAMGAIVRAANIEDDEYYEAALTELSAHVGFHVPTWNDAPERTQSEVVSALRAAALAAQEAEARR
jgi:hypothetical protein